MAPVDRGAGLATDPAKAEKQLFKSVSEFYCDKLTWPENLEEVNDFEIARSRDVSFLQLFGETDFSSPRAILLTISYTSPWGAPRKVSFIAPPRCKAGSDASTDKRDVSIAGGGVMFRLPKGFALMKGAAIQERWKSPPYPDAG